MNWCVDQTGKGRTTSNSASLASRVVPSRFSYHTLITLSRTMYHIPYVIHWTAGWTHQGFHIIPNHIPRRVPHPPSPLPCFSNHQQLSSGYTKAGRPCLCGVWRHQQWQTLWWEKLQKHYTGKHCCENLGIIMAANMRVKKALLTCPSAGQI